jgi:hypothetical protein
MPLTHMADRCALPRFEGVRCRAGNGQRLGRQMGSIVKFPDDGRIVRFGRGDAAEESATIIILPVVRIERHEGVRADSAEPQTPPPAQNGGRRRVRRR